MSRREDEAPRGEIVVYQPDSGSEAIAVRLEGEMVWLTQRQLAELYQVGVNTINYHIKSICREGEAEPEATIRQYRIVQIEGERQIERLVDHYNLDMILAIGYRVRSNRGVQFRRWATAQLGAYLVKGFVLDDERLKGGGGGVVDYFDELLGRIREIRASEARVYQRIREIFSLAADYCEGVEETQRFFASMQNKMHYAATGLTVAEIICERADAAQPNMGLTNWKGGRVVKGDVGTAKNYLDAQEIDTLNRITVMFLDQAEFRAQRRRNIHMADWEVYLDKFLVDTELPVLAGGGSIRHERAKLWAEQQYDAFAERRRVDAEEEAEARYVEDLRRAAEVLKPKARSKRGKGGKTNLEDVG